MRERGGAPKRRRANDTRDAASSQGRPARLPLVCSRFILDDHAPLGRSATPPIRGARLWVRGGAPGRSASPPADRGHLGFLGSLARYGGLAGRRRSLFHGPSAPPNRIAVLSLS